MRRRFFPSLVLLVGCGHTGPSHIPPPLVSMQVDDERAWAIVETTAGDPRTQTLYACRREPPECVRVSSADIVARALRQSAEDGPVEQPEWGLRRPNVNPERVDGAILGELILSEDRGAISEVTGRRFWMISGTVERELDSEVDSGECDAWASGEPELRIVPEGARTDGSTRSVDVGVATIRGVAWAVRSGSEVHCGATSDVGLASFDWDAVTPIDVYVRAMQPNETVDFRIFVSDQNAVGVADVFGDTSR